jgi:hypothetical protein
MSVSQGAWMIQATAELRVFQLIVNDYSFMQDKA